MAVKTTTALKAAYALDNGKVKTYSLSDPAPGLDRAAVEPALQVFVTGDLICDQESGAHAVGIQSAVVREVSEDKLI